MPGQRCGTGDHSHRRRRCQRPGTCLHGQTKRAADQDAVYHGQCPGDREELKPKWAGHPRLPCDGPRADRSRRRQVPGDLRRGIEVELADAVDPPGQLSRLGTAFYVFGLVLLPTLTFVGLTTFDRALHNAVEDVQLAGRINRIRQFYFDAAPQVARYLPPPGGVSPWEIARQAGVSSPFWFQFLTIAGALAVVNSVLIGSTLGLAVQAGTGTLAASASVGVITGAAALAGHVARQRAIWRAARQSGSIPTPAGG